MNAPKYRLWLKRVSLGPLLWLPLDQSRPHPCFSFFFPSFPSTFFSRTSATINVTCSSRSLEKAHGYTHVQNREAYMLCASGSASVGTFHSVPVRWELSSRHQKAAHWPRCWNELTSKVAINQTVMPPYATPSPKTPSVILETLGHACAGGGWGGEGDVSS